MAVFLRFGALSCKRPKIGHRHLSARRQLFAQDRARSGNSLTGFEPRRLRGDEHFVRHEAFKIQLSVAGGIVPGRGFVFEASADAGMLYDYREENEAE